MSFFAYSALKHQISEDRKALSRAAVKRHEHIVDVLIAERAIGLSSHWSWPLVRPFFYKLLGYKRAVVMADIVDGSSSGEHMNFVTRLLNLQLDVTGLGRLPQNGPFILAANHPTGIADGIAVYELVKSVRPDMAIFANRDAVRVNPNLYDIIIPVEWREEHKTREKTREALQLTAEAFEAGKAVVIFPSGRIAYWTEEGLKERPWQVTLITLARRYKVPIVPVNVSGRNSGLFYFLSRVSNELRDMTVFHELLNKSGTRFGLTIGRPIEHARLTGDAEHAARALQKYTVETLRENPDADFRL